MRARAGHKGRGYEPPESKSVPTEPSSSARPTWKRALQRLFFPDPVRVFPRARAWNITFRTAHIGVTGILLGGHVFEVAEARLRMILHFSILTGVCLIAIEAYPSCRWLYQGR